MRDIDRRVAEIASTQGGAVARRQIDGLGVTRGQIQHRVGRGRWEPIRSLGFRVFPARSTRDLLLSATALLPYAVVSHRSAASIHGFPALRDQEPHVTVHTRTTHVFPGVVVHRCHDLRDTHVGVVDALPVTTAERTVVDLAAMLSKRHLLRVTERLLDQQLVSGRRLELVAADVARKGKPGTRRMREVLRALEVIDHEGGSPLERKGRLLLEAHGLGGFRSEYPIPWAPHRRFDDAYPEYRLAIEWDSFRHHGERDVFESDRRRDREAVEHGWRVLRFTWRNITDDPAGVVASVEAAIDQAG